MFSGQNYAGMFYLHSGVINVVSQEDNITPILTLTAGTLLGEASLCMIHNVCARIYCATECEIKLLPLASYNRLASKYHHQFVDVQQEIHKRINIARKRKQANTSTMPLKRLKKQWRCISALHSYQIKHGYAERSLWEELDKGFYSKYLDLIVLADRPTAGQKVICLNSKCPYVMDPNTSFRRFFAYIHLAVVVIHVSYI